MVALAEAHDGAFAELTLDLRLCHIERLVVLHRIPFPLLLPQGIPSL
jgi:hypothetical protein